MVVLLPLSSSAENPVLTGTGGDADLVVFKIDGWDCCDAKVPIESEAWIRINHDGLRGDDVALRSASFGIIGSVLSIVLCFGAAGQSQTAFAETHVWPEADAHVEMPSHLRLLAFGGLEEGVGYPYRQWYAAVALGYQFKPILRTHWVNIDPEKEPHFLFGGSRVSSKLA